MSVGKVSQKRFKPGLGVPSIYFSRISSWQDACVLALIALIGLLGSIYLFKSAKVNPLLDRFNEQEAFLDVSDAQTVSLSSIANDIAPCTVSGVPAVGKHLKFTVNTFKAEATYIADFGNGELKVIEEDQFHYAYTRPGAYEVKLHEDLNGERKTLFSGKFEIGKAGLD
jgi:hypothetical protein